MNRMEQDLIKKSELKNIWITITSTVTILGSIYFGGVKMKDAIVDDIRAEFRAEITNKLNEFDAKQALKDKDQDYKIERIEIAIQNIGNERR